MSRQRLKPAQPAHLIRDPAGRRQALMEEAWQTALFVLGAMLLLLMVVVVVRVLYLFLTMRNGITILPVRGLF